MLIKMKSGAYAGEIRDIVRADAQHLVATGGAELVTYDDQGELRTVVPAAEHAQLIAADKRRAEKARRNALRRS